MDLFGGFASEMLAENHSIRFRANGSSMRPFILDGDSIEIQPVLQRSIKCGDVVLYHLPTGRLLVHRVVRVRGNKLLLQGDGNLALDGWIERSQILGKADALYRNGKRIDFESPGWNGLSWLWMMVSPLRNRLKIWLRAWRSFRANKKANGSLRHKVIQK